MATPTPSESDSVLTLASQLVDSIGYDAPRTERNAQQCLLLLDRCNLILHHLELRFDPGDDDDFSEDPVDHMTTLAAFEAYGHRGLRVTVSLTTKLSPQAPPPTRARRTI